MKQVIVMRTDLKMGKGKIAAQACHASLSAYKNSSKMDIRKWERENQKKVVLKVKSEEELLELYWKIKPTRIACALITDAGHTQIDPNTKTCLGIGPADDDVLDELTGHLKLL
jgi:PTH2 family peptidyl-tRNA hydrolase